MIFRTNGIVESQRWLEDRLAFLRGVLADPPEGADRQSIEAEIASLERGRVSLLRRLFRRPTRTE